MGSRELVACLCCSVFVFLLLNDPATTEIYPALHTLSLHASLPILARLRIACTATCGSSAHAWTHRSPPPRAGSRLSPGNFGRSARAAGRCSARSEEHTSELQSLMRISYAVFCLKKKTHHHTDTTPMYHTLP